MTDQLTVFKVRVPMICRLVCAQKPIISFKHRMPHSGAWYSYLCSLPKEEADTKAARMRSLSDAEGY